jgi:2-dehydropantoate 2-reductase
MRIAVMGAGALGGYFGARLAHAGHEVVFIARGAHLKAMLSGGLRIQSPRGDLHLTSIEATDDPARVRPADLVMISVKLWDTERAAEAARTLLNPGGAAVSFQNGVRKDEVLTRVLGASAVMGGVGYIAATIGEPGLIVHTGAMQKLAFGEFDGTRSARAEALLQGCTEAAIDAELSDDIKRRIWEKFVFLVAISAATTSMRQPLGAIRSNPETRAFLLDLMREVLAVAHRSGINLPADFVDRQLAVCERLPAEMTSSMHQDLKRGNRLELPWLSGHLVTLGREMDIPTPCNRAVNSILALYANGAPAG